MSSSVRHSARNAANSCPTSQMGVIAFTLMLIFAMCHSVLAHEFKAGSIDIVHPWSRATPAGAKVAAGYLKLVNKGTLPDRLIGVTGEIAGKAEIHQMSVDSDGVMTMRALVDGVEIPAGGEVELKPGSYHIMFMQLKEQPKPGVKFKGTLTFEKAGMVEVEFAVDAMAVEETDHSAHGG